MKIYYFANTRIPTEKAHGIQIIKTCQALIKKGVDLELVVPTRFNKIKGDLNSYYGIQEKINIKKIFSLDLTYFETKLLFLIQSISFAKSALLFTLFKIKKNDVIYSRHFFFCWHLSFFKSKKYFYEVHSLPSSFLFKKRVFRKAAGVVTITQKIKDDLIEKGISNKILVAPDGVDLEVFNLNLSKEEVRQKLNLDKNKKIILYSGHLFGWKGAQILAKAARQLKDYLFVFVGGTKEDIAKFKSENKKTENILVAGYRPYREIVQWLKTADVLVLPNSGKQKISRLWTSPMKMFEYMASQKPIVASDLPSLREVLNESNAILVKPDNSLALATGIKKVVENEELAKKIALKAYEDVLQYSWEKRANKIIEFINKSIPRT